MHGLPCSSLGHCFGNSSDVNTDSAPSAESNGSMNNRNNNGLSAADPVTSQPAETTFSGTQEEQHKQLQRTLTCVSSNSRRSRNLNATKSSPGCYTQEKSEDSNLESPPFGSNFSESSDNELGLEHSPELEQRYPKIPRPSIIIRQPKDSEFQETESDRSDNRETEIGGLS
ncbi:hypothetical protein GOODEAATRI_028490, partial [Goodea atripinnis]